jgi:hypothetical protein
MVLMFIQRDAADDGAQGGGGHTGRRLFKVADRNYAGRWIEDFKVPQEVNRNRSVVFGDRDLMRHFTDLLAQIHRASPATRTYRTVKERDQPNDPRTHRLGKHASQAEDHQTLVLGNDLNGIV